MKLTEEQISLIDNGLKKLGILYVDIRAELTDHIASDIEASGRVTDLNIKAYIYNNRKLLQSLERKMVINSKKESFMQLLGAMRKPQFFLLAVIIFFAAKLLCAITDSATVIMLMFLLMGILFTVASLGQYIKTFFKLPQYSVFNWYGFLSRILLLPSLYFFAGKAIPLNVTFAYFSFSLTVTLTMFYNLYKLNARIKTYYNA